MVEGRGGKWAPTVEGTIMSAYRYHILFTLIYMQKSQFKPKSFQILQFLPYDKGNAKINLICPNQIPDWPTLQFKSQNDKNVFNWPNFDQINRWSNKVKNSPNHQNLSFYIKINVFELVFQFWPWFDQNFDRSIEINLSSY